jgi:hypothetical protein
LSLLPFADALVGCDNDDVSRWGNSEVSGDGASEKPRCRLELPWAGSASESECSAHAAATALAPREDDPELAGAGCGGTMAVTEVAAGADRAVAAVRVGTTTAAAAGFTTQGAPADDASAPALSTAFAGENRSPVDRVC